MATLPERRKSWLSEAFTGFPSWADLRPVFGDSHPIRLEEDLDDGHYVIRAELPGIDPAKDVDITVCDGRLTIKAERSEKKEASGRSEFSYGSFTRTVTLPSGAEADDIKATYDNGILTVDMKVPESSSRDVKHVKVQTK